MLKATEASSRSRKIVFQQEAGNSSVSLQSFFQKLETFIQKLEQLTPESRKAYSRSWRKLLGKLMKLISDADIFIPEVGSASRRSWKSIFCKQEKLLPGAEKELSKKQRNISLNLEKLIPDAGRASLWKLDKLSSSSLERFLS